MVRQLVEAYVRAWNQHDSVAFDSILAPDAIHEDIAQNFRGKGSAEVVKFMRHKWVSSRQLTFSPPD